MSTMRNSVMLVGRPGAEPEMKTLNNNQKVARFRIAVNESYKNANNEYTDITYWFNVVAWGGHAERVMKSVRKGKQIAIEGSLRNNEWTDKEGKRHNDTEIWLNDLLPMEAEKSEQN
ncbi:MAG: single-stranded DNA-binding protein [Bacteroidales bacterium]|nr:single-stranded DNA-binding protein [Bacteroidales bacterium]